MKIRSGFRGVKEDPTADIVLNTAYDCRAKFVVSGDGHLLKLRRFGRIKIVSVAEMLKFLKRNF